MTITEIATEVRTLCSATSSDYSDTDLLRRINSAIRKIVGKIEEVCRDIPFDDENFANIAEGTINLSEGVAKYTISDRFRHIREVKVKDVNGDYSIVDPVPQEEDEDIVESEEALTGVPEKYRVTGRTIFLRPAPTATAVTLTAGLLFKYTRTSYQITSSDLSTGTLVPGIDDTWHETIAKMAALPYCKAFKKDRVAQLQLDIREELNDCVEFYANRIMGKHTRFINKARAYK